jgi:hypothetical protein
MIETPGVVNIGFGGPRGGGKSRGIRDVMLIRRLKYAGTTGWIVRARSANSGTTTSKSTSKSGLTCGQALLPASILFRMITGVKDFLRDRSLFVVWRPGIHSVRSLGYYKQRSRKSAAANGT